MDIAKLKMKRNEERRVQRGHPWIFSNELEPVIPPPVVGSLVDVQSAKGAFVGRGFYHPHSLIAVRVLANEPLEIDERFFEKRIEAAFLLRKRLYPSSHVYRLVFGESDRLPGLVIDRYGDYFAIQFLSAGMELRKDVVVTVLRKIFEPKGIVIRNESHLRELEGLKVEGNEVIEGTVPAAVEIKINGVAYEIALEGGQKTGFFLDQRDNREAIEPFCSGAQVLDVFSYSGAFGLTAMKYGASRVVFVDQSQPALDAVKRNVVLNGFQAENECVNTNGTQLLEQVALSEQRFDLIMVDPPAFARSKKHLPKAIKSYEKLNSLAIKSVKSGGIVATSSCSHHLERGAFFGMLRTAAQKVNKTVKVLHVGGQSADHPILLAMPETDYLKFAILQIQ